MSGIYNVLLLLSAAAVVLGSPVDDLKTYLAKPVNQRTALANQAFGSQPLTALEARQAATLLWGDHKVNLSNQYRDAWNSRVLTLNNYTMKFYFSVRGSKPAGGRSLYISMHGGGQVSSDVNDQQWENQKNLYGNLPSEGVYLAPRAPTDSWNMWFQSHIDSFFEQIIAAAQLFEDVNPNRVYIMGYSAGGDGTYQLAPRLADRWAGAAMSAGHPNDAQPYGLRNIAMAIHVGALDAAFNRNIVAAQWGAKLDTLHTKDTTGYFHQVQIHQGCSHWMNLEDSVALSWTAKYTRNPLPERVVWYQNGVTHNRFYWLGVDDSLMRAGNLIDASREGQSIYINKSDVNKITILLNDSMADLDKPVTLTWSGKNPVQINVTRTIASIAKSIEERNDPNYIFSASITASPTITTAVNSIIRQPSKFENPFRVHVAGPNTFRIQGITSKAMQIAFRRLDGRVVASSVNGTLRVNGEIIYCKASLGSAVYVVEIRQDCQRRYLTVTCK